jgi:hypothetical protein
MRVLGIDPGETTGFVEARFDDDGFHVVRAADVTWENRFSLMYYLYCGTPQQGPLIEPPDIVIVESFRLYAHTAHSQIRSDFPSVRVIGMVEAFLYNLPCCRPGVFEDIVFQPASSIALVAIEISHRDLVRTVHQSDAYKHVRYFYITQWRSGKWKKHARSSSP